MARRLGQPLIHFHPTMQHATTPQQLPLGWNRCQSTNASSAADAASSAVRTKIGRAAGGMGVGGSVYKNTHGIQIAMRRDLFLFINAHAD